MSAEILTLSHRYLVFKLGGKEFGFEARYLWEAATQAVFTEVPRKKGPLVGVTQIHGKILPVLNMAFLLGVGEIPPSEGFLVVNLEGPVEILAGFAVDLVVGFIKVPAPEIQLSVNNPDKKENPYLIGWAGEDKKLSLIDIEKMIRNQIQST